MTLDKTPVMILEKEVKFLQDFIRILQTREGIDPNATQDKLDGLIKRCKEKIDEFERAIIKLKA